MDCPQSPHWDDPHAGLPPNLGRQDPLSLKVRNSQKAGTVDHTWGTLTVRDQEDKAESSDPMPAEETLGGPGGGVGAAWAPGSWSGSAAAQGHLLMGWASERVKLW